MTAFDFSPLLQKLHEQFKLDRRKIDTIAAVAQIQTGYLYKLIRGDFQPSREILSWWSSSRALNAQIVPYWFWVECGNADPDGAGPVRSNPSPKPVPDFKKLDANGNGRLDLADNLIHNNRVAKLTAEASTRLLSGPLDADAMAEQAKLSGEIAEALECGREVLARLAHA